MILDITTKPHQLKADEGKRLYDKTVDVEKPEERYYFTVAYVPDSMTLAECTEKYADVDVLDSSDIGA